MSCYYLLSHVVGNSLKTLKRSIGGQAGSRPCQLVNIADGAQITVLAKETIGDIKAIVSDLTGAFVNWDISDSGLPLTIMTCHSSRVFTCARQGDPMCKCTLADSAIF
jgi:hypothetical protein